MAPRNQRVVEGIMETINRLMLVLFSVLRSFIIVSTGKKKEKKRKKKKTDTNKANK